MSAATGRGEQTAVQDQWISCVGCGEMTVPMPADFMRYGCQPAPCTACGTEQPPLDDGSGVEWWGD